MTIDRIKKYLLIFSLTFFICPTFSSGDPLVRGNILKKIPQFLKGEKITFLVHVFNPDQHFYRAEEGEIWVEIFDPSRNLIKKTLPIKTYESIHSNGMVTFKIESELPMTPYSELLYRVTFKNQKTFSSKEKTIQLVGSVEQTLEFLEATPVILSKNLGLRGVVNVLLKNPQQGIYKPGEILTWIEFSKGDQPLGDTIKVLNNDPLSRLEKGEFKIPFSLSSTDIDEIDFKVFLQTPNQSSPILLGSFPLNQKGKGKLSQEVHDALSLLKDYEIPLTGQNLSKTELKGEKNQLYSDELELVEQEKIVENGPTDSGAKKGEISGLPQNLPKGFFTLETPDETIVVYQVKPGDSLSSISKSFFGSEDRYKYIANLNFISDKKSIKKGDELIIEVFPRTQAKMKVVKIPSKGGKLKNSQKQQPSRVQTLKPNGAKYTVKKGETLTEISEKIYGNFMSYKKILEANGIKDPSKIRPGMVLKIPN